jgi:hypothetical protein
VSSAVASSPTSRRPSGVTALSVFFAFSALACVTAGALLLFPGGPLDAAWRLNPRGHEGFERMGVWALPLLAAVGVACAFAAIGLWRNASWGYRLAIAILGVNGVGDALNAVAGHDPRSWIGVPIALALIAYLIRQGARRRAEA